MSALVEAGIKSFGLGRGWKSGVSRLGDGATAPARGVACRLGLAQVATGTGVVARGQGTAFGSSWPVIKMSWNVTLGSGWK